jgi:hypothetical protein
MKLLAVITDTTQVLKIPRHLIKIANPPPHHTACFHHIIPVPGGCLIVWEERFRAFRSLAASHSP